MNNIELSKKVNEFEKFLYENYFDVWCYTHVSEIRIFITNKLNIENHG